MSIQPTHEDALKESRAIMRRALTQIAWYATAPDSVRETALDALKAERIAYTQGVLRAVD